MKPKQILTVVLSVLAALLLALFPPFFTSGDPRLAQQVYGFLFAPPAGAIGISKSVLGAEYAGLFVITLFALWLSGGAESKQTEVADQMREFERLRADRDRRRG